MHSYLTISGNSIGKTIQDVGPNPSPKNKQYEKAERTGRNKRTTTNISQL